MPSRDAAPKCEKPVALGSHFIKGTGTVATTMPCVLPVGHKGDCAWKDYPPAAIGREEWDRDQRIFERGRRSALDTLPFGVVIEAVRSELERAVAKFPAFSSPHEGKAVIEEELEELWEHVKKNTGRGLYAREEAIQVAAMALRYAVDLCYGPEAATDESWIGAE